MTGERQCGSGSGWTSDDTDNPPTMPTNAHKSAKPSKSIFDPFNSSATGHQRADNRLSGSTSWRDSRSLKLGEQFSAGTGGGKRVSDTVGAGSLDFGRDGRTENGGWVPGAKGLRKNGQRSIWETLDVDEKTNEDEERPAKRVKVDAEEGRRPTRVVNPFTPFRKEDGNIRETSWTSHESSPSHVLEPMGPTASLELTQKPDDSPPPKPPDTPPQIFAHLTIYINGSTAPYIGDHKLKHLLSSHGASLSIALGRRSVTHVIVGKPVGSGGCGGGLSGRKIQKEVQRVGGRGLHYVTAEWAVESVEAGKRLSESRFSAVGLGGRGVSSVAGMFRQQKAGVSSKDGKG